MNRILSLVGLLLLTLSFTVLAQEEVDETLSVSPGARVLIDNMRGKVELIVHEKMKLEWLGHWMRRQRSLFSNNVVMVFILMLKHRKSEGSVFHLMTAVPT